MNLDELARGAADELRAGSAPDAATMLDDLRRTRTRRSALRAAVVVVVFLLIGGGVALARSDHRVEAPTHPVGPGRVSNGAIVSSSHRGVFLVSGDLDHLPTDAGHFSMVQFTQGGSELVYGRRSGDLVAMNVASGATRLLAPCRALNCVFAAVSPDGTQVAMARRVGGRNGVEVRAVESGDARFIPTQGLIAGWPRWSPDGGSLVFTGRHGLYLMSVDGDSGVRLLDRYPPGTVSGLPASWSPDGRTIAFLHPRPVTADPRGTAYTLMTVRPDGTDLHRLRELGRCECVGIAPPAVAWSPDGQQIAVTVIRSGRTVTDASSGGLYSIHPDGTGWTPMGSSADITYLAWQPVPER